MYFNEVDGAVGADEGDKRRLDGCGYVALFYELVHGMIGSAWTIGW